MKKKITTSILDFFAPNYCYFCHKIGNLVCEECFKKQNFTIKMISRDTNHNIKFDFFLGDREGNLAQILDEAKFNGWKEYFEILSEILSYALDKNPKIQHNREKLIIIPAPTSAKHIRRRGIAHSEFMTKCIAERLNVRTAEIIIRKSHFVQKGASAKVRKEQADNGYELRGEIDPEAIYCVFDDIRTTGATLNAISKILFNNGAREVWSIYLMQQK